MGTRLLSAVLPAKYNLGCFSTRYEEAEVRKKLEEKDRQEEEQLQQKRQEAGKEDASTTAKGSLESVLDSKSKPQRVFHISCIVKVCFC